MGVSTIEDWTKRREERVAKERVIKGKSKDNRKERK